MSAFGLNTSKSDAPQRTAEGQRWCRLPIVSGVDENITQPSACAGCAFSAAHGHPATRVGYVTPFGQTITEPVPSSYKLEIEDIRSLFAAAQILGHVFQPPFYGALFNAGSGANNHYDERIAEIVSVSGDTITLRPHGWNPRDIVLQRSRANPEWPLPDPLTEEEGALVSEDEHHALPLACEIRFLAPSVLEGKLRPWVKRINMPASADAGEDFSVELSCNVSFARQPADAAFPPADGKYYCTIVFYSLMPPANPNLQPETQVHWKQRTITIAQEEAAADPVELLDTADESTRILWPGMIDDAGCRLVGLLDGVATEIPDIAARLVNVQSSGGWETYLDLTDIADAYDSFSITYCCEAVSGDEDTFPFCDRCANSQTEHTGSYDHEDGFRCTAKRDASKFDNYRADCWQPGIGSAGCDHFTLGNAYEPGNAVRPPSTLSQIETLLGALVYGTRFTIRQGVPGVSASANFTIQPALPSLWGIASFLGSFIAAPFEGRFERILPLWPPSHGQRELYEDGEGIDAHRLLHGAFIAAEEWNVFAAPPKGLVPEELGSGWTSQADWRGAARDTALAYFPLSALGGAKLYSREAVAVNLRGQQRLVDSEAWANAIRPDTVPDAALVARVREIVEGTT